jgi:hypothetical protein
LQQRPGSRSEEGFRGNIGAVSTQLQSYLVGTTVLSLLLILALVVSMARPLVSQSVRARRRVLLFAGVSLAVQTTHFVEEWLTGFHHRFPKLLGLQPWSVRFFVTFNVVWLAIWLLSLVGLRAGAAAALLPLWFLAFASIVNFVAHPLLALRVSGYFPGLLTAPFLGITGIALLRELIRFTEPRNQGVIHG